MNPPTRPLPLGLLAVDERLEDDDDAVQRGEVLLELLLDLGRVVAELDVEVLAVGAGAHGGGEDGLDEEAVVGLQGARVRGAEGVGELGGGVLEVVLEGLAGEFETAGLALAGESWPGWGRGRGRTERTG